MFHDKKVVVVMPAYNAARTLKRTYEEVMAQGIVDLVVVVDDASQDETTAIAQTLPHTAVHTHPVNRGYGANQKTCYQAALDAGADIVIMVHPDYQYTPKLIPALASLVGNGLYSCVLGSRILGGLALQGGMPLWKYFANRFLTFTENLLLGVKLSEYHTGYRAFSRELLLRLPLQAGSDKVLRLHHFGVAHLPPRHGLVDCGGHVLPGKLLVLAAGGHFRPLDLEIAVLRGVIDLRALQVDPLEGIEEGRRLLFDGDQPGQRHVMRAALAAARGVAGLSHEFSRAGGAVQLRGGIELGLRTRP